jgi:hypothetical protein
VCAECQPSNEPWNVIITTSVWPEPVIKGSETERKRERESPGIIEAIQQIGMKGRLVSIDMFVHFFVGEGIGTADFF